MPDVIIELLKELAYGVETTAKSITIADYRGFNLRKLGNGKGVRNFTVQNTGRSNVIIEDTNQIVRPGESFTILGPHRVVNEKFAVSFGTLDASTSSELAVKQAIIWYLVDVC